MSNDLKKSIQVLAKIVTALKACREGIAATVTAEAADAGKADAAVGASNTEAVDKALGEARTSTHAHLVGLSSGHRVQ